MFGGQIAQWATLGYQRYLHSGSIWPMEAKAFKISFIIKVIAAEGEQKASRALRDASEVIAESSAALQLRYLQVNTNAPRSSSAAS